jgi:hypothetical protein
MATAPAAEGSCSTIFGFEADFAGSLRCIPMAVRLKLDQCGVKVSLRQWNRFTRGEREALLAQSCDGPAETRAYRDCVVGLIEARTGECAVELPQQEAPQWADVSQVPAAIDVCLVAQGLPTLSLVKWAGLAPLQRYALLKLTRASHDNDNFLPALREFGLLRN